MGALEIWPTTAQPKKPILCQGRGSAANSIVCYALGITEVNPEDISVLFERFLSEERDEPPDIDVDFEHERREEVIQHVFRKYGRHAPPSPPLSSLIKRAVPFAMWARHWA